MSSSLEAKIVVLGAQGVGKTSLVTRYCRGSFDPATTTSTVGASFLTKRVLDADTDTVVRLQIWDTAGQERFRSISRLYYRGANACILCYSITDAQSFIDMGTWLAELRANLPGDVVLHVVGTKADIVARDPSRRQVPFERCIAYVAENLAPGQGNTPPATATTTTSHGASPFFDGVGARLAAAAVGAAGGGGGDRSAHTNNNNSLAPHHNNHHHHHNNNNNNNYSSSSNTHLSTSAAYDTLLQHHNSHNNNNHHPNATPINHHHTSHPHPNSNLPRSPSSKRSSGFWGQEAGWDACHEISAESGEGVDEVFRVVARKLVERNREMQQALLTATALPGTPGYETGMDGGYFEGYLAHYPSGAVLSAGANMLSPAGPQAFLGAVASPAAGSVGAPGGSFRVGRDRRSWLFSPGFSSPAYTPSAGVDVAAPARRDEEHAGMAERKGGKCC